MIFHFWSCVSLFPKIKPVCLYSGRLPPLLRNPFREETLELSLHFTIFCFVCTMHPCASTNKRFLVWLYLNLCIHSSNNAIFFGTFAWCPACFCPPPSRSCSTPRGSPRHPTCEASTTRETRCFPIQWVPILCFCVSVSRGSYVFSYGKCRLSFFFNLNEAPSNLTSCTETWLHQPDTEPRRAGSRIVQMICWCSMNSRICRVPMSVPPYSLSLS